MGDTVYPFTLYKNSGVVTGGTPLVLSIDISGCRRISCAVSCPTGTAHGIDSVTIQFQPVPLSYAVNPSAPLAWTDQATSSGLGAIAPAATAGFRQDVCEARCIVTLTAASTSAYVLEMCGED